MPLFKVIYGREILPFSDKLKRWTSSFEWVMVLTWAAADLTEHTANKFQCDAITYQTSSYHQQQKENDFVSVMPTMNVCPRHHLFAFFCNLSAPQITRFIYRNRVSYSSMFCHSLHLSVIVCLFVLNLYASVFCFNFLACLSGASLISIYVFFSLTINVLFLVSVWRNSYTRTHKCKY